MNTHTSTIAETILSQLGGLKILRTMIGVTHVVTSDRGLDIRFTARNEKQVNHVRIELNARDYYDVTFYQIRRGGLDCKVIEEACEVDAEDLIETICSTTWLTLAIPRVVGLNA
jgi:hypothetical protein